MVLIPRGIGELAVHKFQWLDVIFWEDRSLGCDANPKVQGFISVVTPAGVVVSACSHLCFLSVYFQRDASLTVSEDYHSAIVHCLRRISVLYLWNL